MNTNPENPKPPKRDSLLLIVLFGCVLVLLLGFFMKGPVAPSSSSPRNASHGTETAERKNQPTFHHRAASRLREKQTAEEKVAVRLAAFDKNRRELAHRYAEKLGVVVPADLEQFFDAADAGNWEEIDRLYKELEKKRNSNDPDHILRKLFPTAQEVFGAHEAVHSWPAQALLNYGRDVLGSLKPGMVYIGGTGPGRFIPTFLNETSAGEHHIVLTQNALADGTYLDYVNFLYGDRLKTLNGQDSQRAFSDYLQDTQKRFVHDQQFPNEPKQMRLNENYKIEEGRVQVSGQVAVMSINELLVKMLQQKNPELSFAMQESFSLPSTYEGAVPLGPILELGSANAEASTPLTPSVAASSLDYWRSRIGQLTSDPNFDPDHDSARDYAHMIVAQGNLFSSQNLSAEAEQAYRMAQQLAANHPEPVSKLYDLLRQTGRANEAAKILSQFQQAHPDKAEALQNLIRGK